MLPGAGYLDVPSVLRAHESNVATCELLGTAARPSGALPLGI